LDSTPNGIQPLTKAFLLTGPISVENFIKIQQKMQSYENGQTDKDVSDVGDLWS